MSNHYPRHVVFSSLSEYRARFLLPDILAGLTVWAVLVPEALAYATIAGVPPVVGLYAAVPALILYAAAGSSRHLIVGPMSATAALSAAIVAPLAAEDSARAIALTTVLALATGILGVLAGLMRFGFVASFISEPVLKGFIVGLALTIIVGQIPALIGIDKGSGNFFEQAWSILGRLNQTHSLTAALGIVSFAAVLAVKRWIPVVPGSLLVVLVSIGAVSLFHLDDRGVDIVGPVNAGLPAVGLPSDTSLSDLLDLLGPAVGVLLIGFAEGLGAAKTYAAKAGYTVDPNRELLGLGAANVGSGLCSGMVVNGSLSKTAVNGGAGARTQVSGLVVAALTVITLLFLTGLFEQLPEATPAAVVIAAVVELVDVDALVRLYRVWSARLGSIYGHAARTDFAAAMAAMLGVLVFDTLPGLIIGVAVSMLLLLYRASRPHVAPVGTDGNRWVDLERNPDVRSTPGILVVRVESGLFFANADHVRDRIVELMDDATTVVVLDAETSPFIDVSAAQMLVKLRNELERRNIAFRVARDIGQFHDVLVTTGKRDPLPVFVSVADALSAENPPRTQ